MQPEASYQPQYLDEAETLLGAVFAGAEDDYTEIEFQSDEIGFKRFAYGACLRILAEARNEDRELARKEPSYEPRAWNEQYVMTVRSLGEIAFRYHERVAFLSRQLAIIEGSKTRLKEDWPELRSRLRENQESYILDLVATLQREPHSILHKDADGDTWSYPVHGTTLVAPTGFGKTRLLETCAQLLNVGRPLNNTVHGEQPVRMAVVTPSIITLEQNLAALQHSLPHLKIGRMDGGSKQSDGDVTVMTIEAFNALFRDNRFDGQPIDIVAIDEGHHLVEPKFRKTFVEEWRGTSVVFTATPAYDLHRTVRKIIPHVVENTDILACIENKTLNDGQIFTFAIGEDEYQMLLEQYGLKPDQARDKAAVREAIDTLVIDFIKPLIEEGRRGIIFCERGMHSAYARRLAERLAATKKENGRHVRAAAVSSRQGNQRRVMDDYRAGKIDVVTTVDIGREGLNASFDFVIINCNIYSRLRGHQIVGRGTRLSKNFPVTVYGQFVNLLAGKPFTQLYSIEEAFASESTLIQQGQTISAQTGMAKASKKSEELINPLTFSTLVQTLLQRIDGKLIGETFVAVTGKPPLSTSGKISLRDMLQGLHATEKYAKDLLRRAGYAWRGEVEIVDGQRRLMHYYDPEARDYLKRILPSGVAYDAEGAAEALGIAVHLVRELTRNPANEIKTKRSSKKRSVYDENAIQALREALNKIPGTQPGDMPAFELAAELGIAKDTVFRWLDIDVKNRVRFHNRHYLTAAEVKQLREQFYGTPVADPSDMYLVAIAKQVGAKYQIIEQYLTQADYDAAIVKRYKNPNGATCVAPHWTKAQAEEIMRRVEGLTPQPLPAHIVPVQSLERLVRGYEKQIPGMYIVITEGGFAITKRRISNVPQVRDCVTWEAVTFLQKRFGARRNGNRAVVIDPLRLPLNADDLDPDKIAYAQSIQRQLLPKAILQTYETSQDGTSLPQQPA